MTFDWQTRLWPDWNTEHWAPQALEHLLLNVIITVFAFAQSLLIKDLQRRHSGLFTKVCWDWDLCAPPWFLVLWMKQNIYSWNSLYIYIASDKYTLNICMWNANMGAYFQSVSMQIDPIQQTWGKVIIYKKRSRLTVKDCSPVVISTSTWVKYLAH